LGTLGTWTETTGLHHQAPQFYYHAGTKTKSIQKLNGSSTKKNTALFDLKVGELDFLKTKVVCFEHNKDNDSCSNVKTNVYDKRIIT